MDRRLARTKRNIRRALFELTSRKSIQDITVTELAACADIDRKTFYLHYGTVLDVAMEIEEEAASGVVEILRRDPEPSIEHILHGLNSIMQENIDFYRNIAGETSISFLKNVSKDKLKEAFFEVFYDENTSGMDRAHFNIYAEYVSSGIIGIYTDWLISKEPVPLENLVTIATYAVDNGWKEILGLKQG